MNRVTHVGKQVFGDNVHICDAVNIETAEQLCVLLNGPKVGDGTPDAALAIGEHAFRAGWEACLDAATPPGPIAWSSTVDRAWDEYDPPEDIKALS